MKTLIWSQMFLNLHIWQLSIVCRDSSGNYACQIFSSCDNSSAQEKKYINLIEYAWTNSNFAKLFIVFLHSCISQLIETVKLLFCYQMVFSNFFFNFCISIFFLRCLFYGEESKALLGKCFHVLLWLTQHHSWFTSSRAI